LQPRLHFEGCAGCAHGFVRTDPCDKTQGHHDGVARVKADDFGVQWGTVATLDLHHVTDPCAGNYDFDAEPSD
jgi:hypothetical protein